MFKKANPFVTYLNRYTTVSSDHEAAFDEFITQAKPPGEPLRLRTRTEQFVSERFSNKRPPSIILTGNAGDGKTYLSRQIIESFTGDPVKSWSDRVDWSIERDGHTLRVVKDLSEMSEEDGRNILAKLAEGQEASMPPFTFLIAANEGRLRALLSGEKLRALSEEVNRQLREGPDLGNERLIILNLNKVTTSTYVPQVLGWVTSPNHWQACQGCPAFDACPIRFNATRLANAQVVERLRRLYQILEHLAIHITIRDMLIHLAYTVTGGLDCQRVMQKSRRSGWEAYRYVYYENTWGEAASDTFRRKALVIRHLRRLNVGQRSVFEVDDFIVNGRGNDEVATDSYERLFAPALDLGHKFFGQDREAYLQGGASSPQPGIEHELMRWFPHCRRKLFFEWNDEKATNKLFPFRYLAAYFGLTDGDEAWLLRYQPHIVLGLNRAFSGLFLTNKRKLFVTSQYAHAVEQPVPIVKLHMSADHVELCVEEPSAQAFDNDLTTLHLEIYPPPRVRAEPISWSVNLLRFEYLMRRADGGTLEVLDDECELAIRQLKNRLLSAFTKHKKSQEKINFFAADRNGYKMQTIWVDENGKIRA